MYDKIINTPGGYLSTYCVSTEDYIQQLWQLSVVTHLQVVLDHGDSPPIRDRRGVWRELGEVQRKHLVGANTSMETMAEEFQLPELPGRGRLAYCVGSEWPVRASLAVVGGIGPMQRAAVLDEMYVV